MLPIAALIPYIPQMIEAGKGLWGLVVDVRKAAQQTGEWTAEHERLFLAKIEAANDSDHWSPENAPQAR